MGVASCALGTKELLQRYHSITKALSQHYYNVITALLQRYNSITTALSQHYNSVITALLQRYLTALL